jgi:hypothetical protein
MRTIYEEECTLYNTEDKTYEIEEAYRKEDEQMMIRLIKVRGNLWT